MTKVQPGGDSLTYYERGDESFHYFETADGYLLIQDSTETFYYADSAADISKRKALNADERSVKDKAFLNSLDKAKVKSLYREKTGVKKFIRTPATIKRGSNGALLKPTVKDITKGSPKFIVIMVYTSSSKSYQANNTKSELSALLNESGYSKHGNFGSIRDYYVEQSNGAFTPTFDVYGPVQISLSGTIKAANDNTILSAALNAAGISDFSQYSIDGQYLNGVIIMTPGTDTDGKGSTYENVSYYAKGGNYTVANYIIAPELGSGSGHLLDGMGTITHEFGHLLGLMDHYVAYNATNGTALTPTYWDVMDVGCYNGTYSSTDSGDVYGTHVPNFSAFERQSLGWLTPTELSTTDGIYAVDSIQSNTAYTVSTSNNDEWFLIENRQQKGWDSELPGHGLLVWHIDYDENAWEQDEVNSDAAHQRVDIEEADNSATSKYAYPTGARTFNNFATWSSSSAHSGLYNITEKNGIVCFTFSSGTAVTNCTLGSSSSAGASSSSIQSSSSAAGSSSSIGSSSATYSGTATLTKCGTGNSRQTVEAGSAITDFCYTWTNANTVSVTGLPDGVTATVIQSSSKVNISGTVSASAAARAYTFMVTTVGAATNATKSGAITVANSTGFITGNTLYATPRIAISGRALAIDVPMNGSKTLELYSLEGKLLQSIPFDAASLLISAADLPAKVFLARISVNGKFMAEKIIALP
ncbi:MAG: M6 family metalloprotease domain-containing protein [Fibrobacteraceae bacterium]